MGKVSIFTLISNLHKHTLEESYSFRLRRKINYFMMNFLGFLL